MMAYERYESARQNFGKFIHRFQPETKTLRKLEGILIKLYRQNVSLLFNQACMHTHTHTHTHTHIYIYIYIYIDAFFREGLDAIQFSTRFAAVVARIRSNPTSDYVRNCRSWFLNLELFCLIDETSSVASLSCTLKIASEKPDASVILGKRQGNVLPSPPRTHTRAFVYGGGC